MNDELNWKITPAEKREQIQKGVFVIGPLIIGFVFFALTSKSGMRSISFKEITYSVLGAIVSFTLLLLINKIFPYKERIYSLSNNGLIISKGKKTKQYLWSDFECFYPYSERYGFKPNSYQPDIEEKREEIFEAERGIEGEIFYLKKKSKNIFSKLYKVFVVVYSEINNQKAVNRFLSNQLSKKTVKTATDLGLVFYEFE
jgi:hypothetical protein